MSGRILTWICTAAGITLIVIVVTGGFRLEVGRVRISAHSVATPTALLVIGGLSLWRAGARRASDILARISTDVARQAPAIAAVSAASIAGVGVGYGTYAASSSDPSAYVSHAALIDRGEWSLDEPLARAVGWHEATWTFTPLGYRPGPTPGAIVPGYPLGLSLVMAAARRVAGALGPFLVVPALAAAAVLATYAMAARAAGPLAGVVGAVLLASSPIVQFHVVQPMSDVPAMAWWTLAVACALMPGAGAAAGAGALAGLAVLTRPNLAPLAAVVAAVAAGWARATPLRSFDGRRFVAYLVGLAPGVLALAVVHYGLYGSILRSGYGDVSDFFATANIWPNVRDYSRRMVAGEGPALILGAVSLGVLAIRRGHAETGPARALAKVTAAVGVVLLATYLPYGVFPDWSYLRFLMPVWPVAFAVLGAAVAAALDRLPPSLRGVLLIASLTLAVSFNVTHAAQQSVYALHDYEARYRTVGLYLEAALPSNAVVLASQESGSVHHYTGLPIVRWDLLTGDLDEAIARLRALGRRPVLVVEDWEKPALRERFPNGATASLDWAPRAEAGRTTRVGMWDPADRADPAPAIATDRLP